MQITDIHKFKLELIPMQSRFNQLHVTETLIFARCDWWDSICNIVKTPSVTGINSYISVTQSSVSLFVVQYISVRNRMMKYTTKADTIKVRKVDSLIPSSCKDGVTGPCRSGKVPCRHSPSQGVNYHQEVFFSQWTSLTFLVNAHRWLLWQPEDAVMQLED